MMKFRKYIYLLILLLLIGWNRVEAAPKMTCYYISNEMAAQVEVYNNRIIAYLDRLNLKTMSSYRRQPIGNFKHNKEVTFGLDTLYKKLHGQDLVTEAQIAAVGGADYIVPRYDSNSQCPPYIILFDDDTMSNKYHAYAATDEGTVTEMRQVLQRIRDLYDSIWYKGRLKQRVLYAPNKPGMTKEQYYKEYFKVYSSEGIILDGDEMCDLDKPGCTVSEVCEELLGKKDDPNSVRYILNTILSYVRIIVPILIIVLGTIDLAKAMYSAKEDEMKKAQRNFVKRIIAGVVIFFIPALIDIIMFFANMIWDYSSCSL